MKQRPYVIIKTALSLDGYIDDASPERLLLSNNADFDRVDSVRATCDAILVGANTIRKDNPRLLIRSEARQEERLRQGLPPQPIKVTISLSGKLAISSAFFTEGDSQKLVFTTQNNTEALQKELAPVATVVSAGERGVDLGFVLQDLYKRDIRRLLVEGGSSINTQFLQQGFVDELQLSIAGFFVGQKEAARFVNHGTFLWNAKQRMKLVSCEAVEDIAVLTYLL